MYCRLRSFLGGGRGDLRNVYGSGNSGKMVIWGIKLEGNLFISLFLYLLDWKIGSTVLTGLV